MDVTNTACNDYVLCLDCEFGQGRFVAADQEFECPRWAAKVKNVGLCKHYTRCDHGNSGNQ